jgi:hypothetical protein
MHYVKKSLKKASLIGEWYTKNQSAILGRLFCLGKQDVLKGSKLCIGEGQARESIDNSDVRWLRLETGSWRRELGEGLEIKWAVSSSKRKDLWVCTHPQNSPAPCPEGFLPPLMLICCTSANLYHLSCLQHTPSLCSCFLLWEYSSFYFLLAKP